MEKNCTLLLHYDKSTPPNEEEIREELESKDVEKKQEGMKTLISLQVSLAHGTAPRVVRPHRRPLREPVVSPRRAASHPSCHIRRVARLLRSSMAR